MLPLILAFAQGFPAPTVPAGWGVNIHFTDERPGEVAKIAGTFRWVRMDLAWGSIERERGRYDFAAYDRLLAALDRNRVRPLLILDYGNDLYEKGPPRSPEARAAFCRWVAAAVGHFKGRGVVWEMWNEPNGGFWPPKANVEEYVRLAREVGETIRRVAPKETLVGPATSGFDWPFLQRCLDAGLLRLWDAVSVHPYRQNEPETAEADWLRLRAMMDRAGGAGKPMLSGEWGYSELFQGLTKERQADYAVRSYLVNLRCGVPISIWYDWKDDGTDPKDAEAHFGTVGTDLSPKPAYEAMTGLARDLAGFSFVTRLEPRNPRQWVLLFRRGNEAKLVLWTTATPETIRLLGHSIALGPSPQVVEADSNAVRNLRALPWMRYAPDALEDPLFDDVETIGVGDAPYFQTTHRLALRPLRLRIEPGRQGGAFAVLENPFRHDPVESALTAYTGRGTEVARFAITRRTIYPMTVPVPDGADRVGLPSWGPRRLTPVPRFVPIPLSGATATADGDAKVRAAVSATATPDGTRLDHDFDPGWRFAELHPADGRVEGRPSGYGMWVLGDGSGDVLRMRYTDATGQTFQPEFGAVDWKGWRYVSVPIDGSGGRWGGANDGVVHGPIRIVTLALVETPGGRGGRGALAVARPVLVYPR